MIQCGDWLRRDLAGRKLVMLFHAYYSDKMLRFMPNTKRWCMPVSPAQPHKFISLYIIYSSVWSPRFQLLASRRFAAPHRHWRRALPCSQYVPPQAFHAMFAYQCLFISMRARHSYRWDSSHSAALRFHARIRFRRRRIFSGTNRWPSSFYFLRIRSFSFFILFSTWWYRYSLLYIILPVPQHLLDIRDSLIEHIEFYRDFLSCFQPTVSPSWRAFIVAMKHLLHADADSRLLPKWRTIYHAGLRHFALPRTLIHFSS